MVDKPTNLNFMDRDVIKAQPVSELVGDPYSHANHIPKDETRLISCIKLHDDWIRVSICFKDYECFITIKVQEMDQDPTKNEVAQKLTSYMLPQLN